MSIGEAGRPVARVRFDMLNRRLSHWRPNCGARGCFHLRDSMGLFDLCSSLSLFVSLILVFSLLVTCPEFAVPVANFLNLPIILSLFYWRETPIGSPCVTCFLLASKVKLGLKFLLRGRKVAPPSESTDWSEPSRSRRQGQVLMGMGSLGLETCAVPYQDFSGRAGLSRSGCHAGLHFDQRGGEVVVFGDGWMDWCASVPAPGIKARQWNFLWKSCSWEASIRTSSEGML